MSFNYHYEDLCSLEAEIKKNTNIEFYEHRNIVIHLYEINYELLNNLDNKWQNMDKDIVTSKLIAALSYRIITNSMATLKLAETGYYNESKSILRAILENIETKMFFILYPNELRNWTKNKYNMKDIVNKLREKGEIPNSFSKIYYTLSEEGAHAGPKNLINIFKIIENEIIPNLPEELILVKDKPLFDHTSATYVFHKLLTFMGINLIYDRDYFTDGIENKLVDNIEDVLQKTYELYKQ